MFMWLWEYANQLKQQYKKVMGQNSRHAACCDVSTMGFLVHLFGYEFLATGGLVTSQTRLVLVPLEWTGFLRGGSLWFNMINFSIWTQEIDTNINIYYIISIISIYQLISVIFFGTLRQLTVDYKDAKMQDTGATGSLHCSFLWKLVLSWFSEAASKHPTRFPGKPLHGISIPQIPHIFSRFASFGAPMIWFNWMVTKEIHIWYDTYRMDHQFNYIWLVVSNISYFPFHIWDVILPNWRTHIFQRGIYFFSTNQMALVEISCGKWWSTHGFSDA